MRAARNCGVGKPAPLARSRLFYIYFVRAVLYTIGRIIEYSAYWPATTHTTPCQPNFYAVNRVYAHSLFRWFTHLNADQIISKLLSFDSFVISTHLKPDGDAIGSQLALGAYLEAKGKSVTMINTDDVSSNLQWLRDSNKVTIFDGSLSQRESIEAADAIVVVDTNSRNRLGAVGETLANSSATKILIDHHPAPETWFDLAYRRENVSSTGQLIFELIAADNVDYITPAIGEALYVAIMTDTGSFRYSHVDADVHRCIATILEKSGLSPEPMHDALFDNRSIGGLRLLGRALDSIRLIEDGKIGYMVISQQMLRDAGADRDDTEGFVNYILSVDGVKVAIFFFEADSGAKVSLRSKAGYRVDRLARSFGGGGHRNASGIFVEDTLENAVARVVGAAPEYILTDEPEAAEVTDDEVAFFSSLMADKQRNKKI